MKGPCLVCFHAGNDHSVQASTHLKHFIKGSSGDKRRMQAGPDLFQFFHCLLQLIPTLVDGWTDVLFIGEG